MKENQNIEYKQSWHDDYLKWICGFANAQGGKLNVGIDDSGKITGIENADKLMEELPNKIRDTLGVMPAVNLISKGRKSYIEIKTTAYSVPISLRGRYYIRSGSTLQELKGTALTDFLLRKSGRSWDDIIEPAAKLSDIDEESIAVFLKDAEKAGRLPDDGRIKMPTLLEKLRLLEKGALKRAAIILFGKDPGKFYPNLTVRIGRFGKANDDLKFEEAEEGNLIRLIHGIPYQLNRKFFIKPVGFEGLQRIEKGEYPVAAVREMLLNALVHRDYTGSGIQIRMYDNIFSIWNEGPLPTGLSLDALKRQHPSRPRNPIIAAVCFKGGYIDAWGRGTLKIMAACKEAALPEPTIKEQDDGLLVTLYKDRYTQEELIKLGLNERQIKAIIYVKKAGRITNMKYQELCNISKSTATRDINELERKSIFKNKGTKGSSAVYEID